MTAFQKYLVSIVTVIILIAIYHLKSILTPFLVGVILAYLGDPLVDRLEDYKVKRTLGVLLVFTVFLLILFGLALVVIPILVNEVSSLVRDIPVIFSWLQVSASPYLVSTFDIDPFDVSLERLKQSILDNWQQAGGFVGHFVQEVTASGIAMLNALISMTLVPVVAFYLLRDWDDVIEKIRQMIPLHMETKVVTLTKECDDVLSQFVRGQLLIMFLLGCVYALGLTIIGLDLAILIGLVAGLASIVPYLGFVVGILAAVLAALFQFQDLMPLVYVLLVFLVGQGLEGMILTPLLVGDRIGLHPVAVIFAVLAGGQLFGFFGVLLALPIAAVMMVFIRDFRATYLRSQVYDGSNEDK
ncbi:MAG: AI-2E family transporter [Candidatus Azotimanducaceae bacterium]|uniref:AI-2E family transporter n=1 Tax=OM182 bacterium TaxID=2510334 RepID=A0A520S1A1_9GAMM|nr:AI-2E family transporter [Gammaproteobacteria bacterium]OUV68802.1 MAG: AI-2E family transporter [Gammaproteobacteria bacterium TMED133]RZO76239.1 MAG: AI-2E family transporter [OM182 bacterium]